ncbi:MAG: CBS domain-containing protein [Candidatus Omnitrophica bacterium]|nr:CBS domain-containing protein [Candidatus Omnitrophota bacterium]
MKVKEIMTTEVTTLSPEMSAQEALGVLQKMEISGLPVLDAGGKLVGMFTEKEILGSILPSYIDKVGRFVYEENPKSTKKKFSELANLKVSDLMRKTVVVTGEDTTLCEVARMMLTQKIRRIVVVDKAGTVAGLVSRGDVLRAFTRESES